MNINNRSKVFIFLEKYFLLSYEDEKIISILKEEFKIDDKDAKECLFHYKRNIDFSYLGVSWEEKDFFQRNKFATLNYLLDNNIEEKDEKKLIMLIMKKSYGGAMPSGVKAGVKEFLKSHQNTNLEPPCFSYGEHQSNNMEEINFDNIGPIWEKDFDKRSRVAIRNFLKTIKVEDYSISELIKLVMINCRGLLNPSMVSEEVCRYKGI